MNQVIVDPSELARRAEPTQDVAEFRNGRTIRERAFVRGGPGFFGGMSIPKWIRTLSANRWGVDLKFATRAAAASTLSAALTLPAWCESALYANRVRQAAVAPPLFVLGHWRSGTTHLHELLAADERFSFTNLFHTYYPHNSMLLEGVGRRLGSRMLPEYRPMDNVPLSFTSPQEDEVALLILCGLSPYMSWCFPRNSQTYDRYLTFQGATEAEIATWKAALFGFLQKVSLKTGGRPILLKSPPHTARVRLLLDVFPNARFVHIHRDPYTVYQSTIKLNLRAARYVQMQDVDEGWVMERVIRQYREMHTALFEDMQSVPANQFYELRFEDLESRPLEEIEKIYSALNLPDFRVAEPSIRRQVESRSDYRKNDYPDLTRDLRNRLREEWKLSFERWGYQQ